MTREKHDQISERLKAARESVAPIVGRRYHIPPHKTYTLCQSCFTKVYQFPGGLRVNEDGLPHECRATAHDTTPPPPEST
jgi:Zinc finger, ZZ type